MGNAESSSVPGGGSNGYHVLRVQDNSPGQLAGLEPFFDFIVAVGNQRLDQDDESFKQTLGNSVDKPLELTVFNSKSQTVRQTQIIPSNSWGGQGILGISIRFCSFDGANQNVWHIVSVQPKSPSDLAGLQADSDYVLGAESVLQQADDLIALVQANVGKPVKLYVYNVNSDTVREVSLTPNDAWGGEGCLGCDIGYGYLHRIPTSIDRAPPSNIPVQPQTTLPSAVPSSIAQPGFTGIPQLDKVNASSASALPQTHNFPDPSEFAVPLVPVSSFTPTPTSLPPHPEVNSTYQPPVAQPPVLEVSASSEFSYSYQQHIPQNLPPPNYPQIPQQQPLYSSYSSPPVQSAYSVPPVPPPSSNYEFAVPPSITPGFTPSPPTTTPVVPTSHDNSPVAHLEQDLNSLDINHSQAQQPEVPINTSSYQPYLAYGAPALSNPQYPYPPQIPTVQQVSYSSQQYQQPDYPPLPPTSSQGQIPPTVNFPMPPLSSLGISNLVPPVGGQLFPPPQNFNQPQY